MVVKRGVNEHEIVPMAERFRGSGHILRYIEFMDEIPKTPTQKIRKNKLRDRGLSDATWDREAAGYKVRR